MVDVNTANIDALKGMSDVEFDFGVSTAVKAAFRAEASTVTGQRPSRATWRTTGLTDFTGHFSEVFRQNGVTQLSDLDEVAATLRDVATEIEKVEQAAREENQRRATAREWAQRQADRNDFERWWDDHISGGEDPPAVTLSDSGPTASVAQPPRGSRQTPAPGGGGGDGGGTSSARPSDLRSFSTSSKGGDDLLTGAAGRLQRQCDDFASSCSWATLNAGGPIQGLREWLRLNAEDAAWATTVADAFARAGGEGAVSSLSNQTIEAALRANNVAESRRDIEVDPPTAYGSPPTTGYANDPVNTSTGNFTETEVDLGFGGPAAGLQLSRSYNSLNQTSGAFGLGWSSWAEAGLQLDEEAARLRLPDGRQIVFPRAGRRLGAGRGREPLDRSARLRRRSGGRGRLPDHELDPDGLDGARRRSARPGELRRGDRDHLRLRAVGPADLLDARARTVCCPGVGRRPRPGRRGDCRRRSPGPVRLRRARPADRRHERPRSSGLRLERHRPDRHGGGRRRGRRGREHLRRARSGRHPAVAARSADPVRLPAGWGHRGVGRGRDPVQHLDLRQSGSPDRCRRRRGQPAVHQL